MGHICYPFTGGILKIFFEIVIVVSGIRVVTDKLSEIKDLLRNLLGDFFLDSFGGLLKGYGVVMVSVMVIVLKLKIHKTVGIPTSMMNLQSKIRWI